MGTLLARVMVMGAQPFWVVSGPSPLNQAGDRFRADSATDAGPESGGAAFRFRPGAAVWTVRDKAGSFLSARKLTYIAAIIRTLGKAMPPGSSPATILSRSNPSAA